MAGPTGELKIAMTKEDVEKANKKIVDFQNANIIDSKDDLRGLQKKLSATYWVIIALSLVMFVLGILLLSVPFFTAAQGKLDALQSLIAAGFGIADLVSLLLFKPLERIHKLMGDMSQVSLAVNSYQSQVSLRLLQLDIYDRKSIGAAAEWIGKAAEDSIKLIENYFEKGGMLAAKKAAKPKTASEADRPPVPPAK